MAREFKAKSYIESIAPYQQGKSKTSGTNNNNIIKLSSNENALGSSPKAIESYLEHGKILNRYADGSCFKLRQEIANLYNINAQQIVCGAGSDEIISLLMQAFSNKNDEIIYSQYGFLMYPISAQTHGAKAISAPEDNLQTNIDNILDLISPKTKMIFLANPNNPTGSYLTKSEITHLLNNVPKNIIIVLDLAYGEFISNDINGYVDVIDIVQNHDNVVMTRTFSKIYGLASLRLGWSYSCQYIADILNKIRGPFNVNGAAIAAAQSAILDREFIKKSKEHNDKWLKILTEEFSNLDIKYYDSMANFILLDFLDAQHCQKVNQFLLEHGVILRQLSAYNLPSCLRMTIGTEFENTQVIQLLKQFYG